MEKRCIAPHGLGKQLGCQQGDGGGGVAVQVRHLARPYAVGHLLGVAGGLVHRGQALDGVGNFGVHHGEEQRDAVATLAEFILGAGVDGGADPQGHFGQLALGHQVFTYGTGGDGQDHVVDRGTRNRFANPLDRLQAVGVHGKHAMRRALAVEACDRVVAGRGVRIFVKAAQGCGQSRQGAFGRGQHLQRRAGVVGDGVGEHGQQADLFVGRVRHRRHLDTLGAIGRQVVQAHGELGRGVAVQGAMVAFDQQRKATLRQSFHIVQPFDDHHFPWGAAQVKGGRVQTRDQNVELAPVAGLGQGHVAHVVFDVEILVIDPVGIVQPQGHMHQALAKDAGHRQARLDVAQDVLEAHRLLGRSGRVVNKYHRPVRVGIGCVEVEEAGVLTGELAHHGCPGGAAVVCAAWVLKNSAM